MKRVDRDAMRRVIAILRQDLFWATHIEDKLKREGFEKAGHFASYSAQCDALHLKPWETPPCDTWGTVPDPSSWGSRRAEIELRDRLLAAGISCSSRIQSRRSRKPSACASREGVRADADRDPLAPRPIRRRLRRGQQLPGVWDRLWRM